MREPVMQDKRSEHTLFCKEATYLIESVTERSIAEKMPNPKELTQVCKQMGGMGRGIGLFRKNCGNRTSWRTRRSRTTRRNCCNWCTGTCWRRVCCRQPRHSPPRQSSPTFLLPESTTLLPNCLHWYALFLCESFLSKKIQEFILVFLHSIP